jgi:phenylacetate-coenzyme A ligase PaaK-like adenylate-forming protein
MSAAWPTFRRDIQAGLLAGAPEHQQRLGWDADSIRDAQRDGLRALLAHAVERSPFHRRRLLDAGGLDIDTIDLDDLSRLPVMTKADMMDAFDDVVTDRRLGRTVVERALAATGAEPVPIDGDFVAMATGGSSGRRGVFVFDRAALVGFLSSLARPLLARLAAAGGPPPGGMPIAMVAAASAVHATGLAPATTDGGEMPFRFLPVPATLPLPEIVRRLNDLQAPGLLGYPSLLACLAVEKRAGRLRIDPVVITSSSETLTAEVRRAIGDSFGCPVVDSFGSTEGLVGSSAPGDDVQVFNSDMCIVELVDADNRPVPVGVPSTKVLVTNLYNFVQPLIRYELTDTFVQQQDAPEHGHLRARVEGRTDDVLHFDAVDIHPLAVRAVLVKSPEILDYQVHQTRGGIDVTAMASGRVDVRDLEARLVDALVRAGLADPAVSVRIVDRLERHAETSKLRRFVPLAVV